MNLKQIYVKLYVNKSKKFLASWKCSNLVDEKKKLRAVTKYYLVNTFVDTTHSCSRYTKIIYIKDDMYYQKLEKLFLRFLDF